MKQDVRIGLIGTGFMGKSHAMAYHTVPFIFPAAARPVLELVADVSEEAARAAAEATGIRRATGDWRELVQDPAVDVVDITTPNVLHKEMALAAIAAGKHVYCEKPLALTAADALEMTEAAEAAGVKTLVGFNFLKNPAAGMVKGIIDEGGIGDIVHFRGTFDEDALADPRAPFSWRFERAVAGAGALGDLGAHVINLAQYLIGDIDEVSGQINTRITERPVADGAVGYGDKVSEDAPMRAVENEDEAQFLMRFTSGATGTIETSRIATGRKLWLTYEVTGTAGAVFFTQERMNEVKLYRAADPAGQQGFKTVYIGPEHPHYANYFPIAGMGLGYNDQKVIEAHELIEAIAEDGPLYPDFRAGWKTCQVIDAVLRSAEERRWVRVEEV
ncbi:MAG: Gfo/Idh/MocA family oxidoreductase [Proteobacteria bacterium]|nr:Gfo/Idh/MocA family oxidoreductase [Pseudomonadota bacterium]